MHDQTSGRCSNLHILGACLVILMEEVQQRWQLQLYPSSDCLNST